jgi:hypothetical protein
MSDTLIQIGTTKLYSGALNSAYDASANSALDGLTNEALAAIVSRKWLSGEPLSIDHYTDGRATCGLTIYDSAGAFAFFERMQILIEDLDKNKSFAGLVHSAQSTRFPGSDTKKSWVIDAADFTAMLDWRVVDYAAEDTLAGQAVREIMDEYLAEEGITEGYIEDGLVLTEISFGNCSATVALTKLADSQGFVCYLDYDLKLYFHARTLYAAEWSVTDLTDVLAESMQITFANPDFRTTEIVTGGYEETALQIEPFVTDGVLKSFALGYPVNRVVQCTVNGLQKTIGVKGYDSGGGYDCYYANKSETITFDVAPAAGAGEIQYYGLWVAKSYASDLTAIAANAARQGVGSGKVEHVTVDDSLTSIVAAGEYANAKLAEYAVDGITVEYKTRRAGLAAGTLQHIQVQGIDVDALIAHVSETHKDGDTEYGITAYYGPCDETWDLFFRSSFESVQDAVSQGVDNGTGVTKLFNFSHHFLTADRPNPFTSALPGILVSDDSWPCFDTLERTLYIEFWKSGICIFRKRHTSTPDITDNDLFHSYSFVSPSEAIGDIDTVIFYGGDSATAVYGSGVELYRSSFVITKSILVSLQLNASYINGA